MGSFLCRLASLFMSLMQRDTVICFIFYFRDEMQMQDEMVVCVVCVNFSFDLGL